MPTAKDCEVKIGDCDPDFEHVPQGLLPSERDAAKNRQQTQALLQKNRIQRQLRQAVIEGNEEQVISLIEREGPQIVGYASSVSGTNSLHEAAFANRVSILEILLEVSTREEELCEANGPSSKSTSDSVLVKKNDYVNIPDQWGSLPLHLAAEKGHEAICRLLVGSGSNMKQLREDGKAPIHLAKESKNSACFEFLYLEMVRLQEIDDKIAGEKNKKVIIWLSICISFYLYVYYSDWFRGLLAAYLPQLETPMQKEEA